MKNPNFYHLTFILLYLVGAILPITSFLATRVAAQGFAEDILKEPALEEAPRPVAPDPPRVNPDIYEPPPVSESAPSAPPGDTGASPPVGPSPQPRRDPVLTGPRLTRISMGSLEPGVLGRADYADASGRRVRVYQFSGRQNESVILTLTGSNDPRSNGLSLNPYMQVFNLSAPPERQYIGGTILPGEYRILSDNPLVPVDNQLFLRLPDTGEYGVVVYTDPGAEGRFALSLLRDRTRYIQDVTGELTDQSPRLPSDNSPYEVVEFEASQGQTLHIDLSSPDFDAYLFLLGPDGRILAEDDDSGGNRNARIVMELPESGTYRAIVNSFSADGRGRYRLTVY